MGKHYTNYWKSLHEKMKRDETAEFIYRKWFGLSGLENFKNDLISFPDKKHIVLKINPKEPFSPTNYKWVKKPIMPVTPKVYKQKTTRNCRTILFTIDETINQNKSGVYKITFNNGCFYIGSTGNFRKRIGCWTATFNGTSRMHNKLIIKCVAECSNCHFTVLEYMDATEDNLMKQKETEFIKEWVKDVRLLNRAHDASSNKGVRWTEEEKKKTKDALIAKYKSGELIPRVYRYKGSAKPVESLFKSKYFGDKE